MKHNVKIIAIILVMYVITQLIGLYVVGHYLQEDTTLPLGLEPPEMGPGIALYNIIFAFILAVFLFLILTKFKLEFILKLWFFVVVIVALAISFSSFLSPLQYALIISLVLAIPLAVFKVYKRNFLVHNFTELFIYPGIAAIFVPLLNLWAIIVLLILISIYDMWAVWKSGIMIKMAKYQMDTLKIFPGFFIPYVSKKNRKKIKLWKKTLKKSELKKKKIKVEVGVLGGGDVAFPMIAAGVVLKTVSLNLPFGLTAFTGGLVPAIMVIVGALAGLAYLQFRGKKGKFYPAMPYITTGILVGIGLSYLIL